MRILIIEDEVPAADRLRRLVRELLPEATVAPPIDSVSEAVSILKTGPDPALIFMDVELADGLSFDIFRQVAISSPVIFVTAYDHYAVKAFQVDGLHYLLKPVELAALRAAVDKFKAEAQARAAYTDYHRLLELVEHGQKDYKQRFLIKQGPQLSFVPVQSVAWFQAQSGYVCLTTTDGVQSVIDFTIEQLRERLDPQQFFQVNRKFILAISAIQKIESYFNHRLIVGITPPPGEEVIVSRDRVAGFKAWLDA
ncbi:MAG: LytTR family DNA-binding domain-containing protein [Bacteroidota bacterium]